jgi:P27 family predicted phage terminase small subunit
VTGRLEPPDWYPDGHRAIWADTVARLTDSGGVFRADPMILDTYVCAHVNHTKAARLAAETTPVLIRNGQPVANPALAEQRRAAEALARASRHLGLDRNPMSVAIGQHPMSGDGRRWCETHQRDECKHNRKDGSPCHQYQLIPGMGSCKRHAGMTLEQARAQGQANIARLYTSEAMDIDPASALLWEIGHSAAHVADLRAEVQQLAAEPGPDGQPGSGLFYGVYRELWRDGELAERELRPGIHPKLKAYDTERDHLVKTAAAARTTGAQEAAVNVARALGAGVHALMTAIFNDLELAEWQWERVPRVVPARLAEFDPDTRELEAP